MLYLYQLDKVSFILTGNELSDRACMDNWRTGCQLWGEQRLEHTIDKKIEEHTDMKKNKKPMVIIGIVLVLCLVAAGVFAMVANSAGRTLSDQLELGRKYLEEMNYEQAIVAFEAAIAIDPKCEESYLSLAEIYVAQGIEDVGVYLSGEDIYVTGENVEKAIEVLEEGYSQTGSETILTRLEELCDCYQAGEGDDVSIAENGQGAVGQALGSVQEPEGSQASGSGGAGGLGQPAIDENDLFVQFVNAPFTDENGFEDVTSLDAARAYAESKGFAAGTGSLIQPVGDYYISCGEAGGYKNPETDEEFLGYEVSVQTADNWSSYTAYYYIIDYEIPTYSITTCLVHPGDMTGESVPLLGGFAGYLAEHECLTIESILETIGLGDEKFMDYVHMEDAYGIFQVESPYGTVDIVINTFTYGVNHDEYKERLFEISFQEDSNAPFDWIEIGDGYNNGVVTALTVEAGTGSMRSLREWTG